MSKSWFCLNCHNVYNEDAISGIICPNMICNNEELINIDDDLFCILPYIISSGFTIKINEDIESSMKNLCINLSTFKSFLNETAPAYIIFENEDEKKINAQFNICKKVIDSFYADTILITEITNENGKKTFTILTNKAAVINEVIKIPNNEEIETKDLIAIYYVFKAILLKYLFSLKEYMEKNEIKF